jgi:rhodanese-related sulfurtransferase
MARGDEIMGYAIRVENRRATALAEIPVARISVHEALARHREGQRVAFVDARREGEWRRATDKLPGATRLAPAPDDTLPILPTGRTVVAYCTCPGEASSVAAAEILRAGGYGSVCVLAGGLGAWRRAGGPVERT